MTEPLSKCVNTILRAYVPKITSYIQDTWDIIKAVAGRCYNRNQQILVTLDIKPLYSYIPQLEAIEAVSWFMRQYNVQGPRLFIMECLHVVLEENTFEIGGDRYKQIKGVSMGAHVPQSSEHFHGQIRTKVHS